MAYLEVTNTEIESKEKTFKVTKRDFYCYDKYRAKTGTIKVSVLEKFFLSFRDTK